MSTLLYHICIDIHDIYIYIRICVCTYIYICIVPVFLTHSHNVVSHKNRLLKLF